MTITQAHFGANVILTRDSFQAGHPFAAMHKEIGFSHLRYPGGGVTEDQTWANGGLDRMFGTPMDASDPDYRMGIHEAFEAAAAGGQSMSIVIPTFQFYAPDTQVFDAVGFGRYLDALEGAIAQHPSVPITFFEIGNEYWDQHHGLTAADYGRIANAEIPRIDAMITRLSEAMPDWHVPGIGVQAGVQWKAEQQDNGTWSAVGPRESAAIIDQISLDNRALVTTVVQHSYPDADSIAQKLAWALRPMQVFEDAPGFPKDLALSLTEFNIGQNTALGLDQANAWIDAFGQAVDMGIDSIDHWGLAYDWLSNKFYDTKFPPAESDGGTITAIATPMGQVYDIAQSHLVGKTTLTDAEALADTTASKALSVTGFGEEGQRIVFFHNPSMDQSGQVDLSAIGPDQHLSVRVLSPADSPASSWFDESARALHAPGGIADSRADMHVTSGPDAATAYTLQPGEMLVAVISDPERDLTIEGAHNVTDPRTGMVDDLLIGGKGHDILRGHVGNDTLEGGGGHNLLAGGKGDDRLIAGDEGDVVLADGGNDTVEGGKGDDLIIAHPRSADDHALLAGGGGMDTFLVAAGGSATIADFSTGDHLGLGGIFADAEALRAASQADGEDLVITIGDNQSLRLVGQADQIDSIHTQVLDFLPPEEALAHTDGVLEHLTLPQLEELYAHEAAAAFQDDTPHSSPALRSWEEAIARWDSVQGPQDPADPQDPDLPTPTPPVPPTDTGGPDDLPWLPPSDPAPEPRPEEDDEAQNPETASGGACFVATAAFGDPRHPDVVALRAFRDTHLVRSRAGRAFVRAYWVVGPRMARHTRPHQAHARLARTLLSSLVRALRAAGWTQGR